MESTSCELQMFGGGGRGIKTAIVPPLGHPSNICILIIKGGGGSEC